MYVENDRLGGDVQFLQGHQAKFQREPMSYISSLWLYTGCQDSPNECPQHGDAAANETHWLRLFVFLLLERMHRKNACLKPK